MAKVPAEAIRKPLEVEDIDPIEQAIYRQFHDLSRKPEEGLRWGGIQTKLHERGFEDSQAIEATVNRMISEGTFGTEKGSCWLTEKGYFKSRKG